MPALDFRVFTAWSVVAASALLLSGCASFSPNGGMSVVTASVSQDLGKDAVALRTPDEAASARDTMVRLLSKPLSADAAGPDRASQQSRAASRLQ